MASYDEDTTTLGVEAARRALEVAGVPAPDDLFFSTPDPAYLDKTNATTVHAALGLPASTGAYDLCGSVRSGWAAMRLAALAGERGASIAVISDLRTGLPGGAEESQGGDGAAAFVFAPEGAVAEVVGRASTTDEFLDRWRVPGETASRQWEDRFGEEALVPLARAAFAEALRDAGLSAADIDHLVVAGLHARAVGSLRKDLGVPAERVAPDYSARIGNLGAAQAATGLADVLERASVGPGDRGGRSGRRRRRGGAPHHSGSVRGPGGTAPGRPGGGGPGGRSGSSRSALCGVPDLAGQPPA